MDLERSMNYNLRKRRVLNKKIANLGSTSGSDNESNDSTHSDPDYGKPMPARNNGRPSGATQRGGGIRIGDTALASSSKNAATAQKRRPGRPPKAKANGAEDRPGNIEERSTRRKRKDISQSPVECIYKRTVLAWLISLGIVGQHEKVWYVDEDSGRILAEGKIRAEGVVCDCCSRVITVGDFEIHAGRDTKKPYQHILLASSRISLLECQIEAWLDRMEEGNRAYNNVQPAPEATDKSDDACMVCADGGNLVCCERCPSTCHSSCIFLGNNISGDEWLCPYCVCKYCAGGDGTLKKCTHCEKQYHCKCGGEKLDLNSPTSLFCGDSCKQIYEGLQSMLGVRNDLVGGLSWTLLQRTEPIFTAHAGVDYNRVVVNSKIAVAWMVMNECFVSSIDRHSGANVVQSIVYNIGSNLTRLNFSGFYTAVLEKNDEIICAASVRVHGKRLAEMPFIGTRTEFRRRGMARTLENCVESALCDLKVEKLVIPSLQQLAGMWMEKYLFSHIEEDRLKMELSQYNTVTFPSSVVRLQKTLSTLPDLNGGPSPSETNEGSLNAI
ncbi:Acyl-CoA N-acyltransferase with RING/FYVE/PHD-type zinc finger protein, putative [Theobroma cacao]|uniref:Acyl-CoA N-acyltransferase with RING/FYVE/PHD-type zinc finger protein, putative n=1 Tax=Theobroma cacao TaxID=3641 RepID=A0A061G4Y8_THECC|nr:Acyl-CoA N-acyltransferase with RING/FYVE/PHD-type zinc finger protein, putative [Theobroma cacao]